MLGLALEPLEPPRQLPLPPSSFFWGIMENKGSVEVILLRVGSELFTPLKAPSLNRRTQTVKLKLGCGGMRVQSP